MMIEAALALAVATAPGAIATTPAAARQAAPNPRVAELFERDPLLRQWALAQHDGNHDGWLTLFEAQAAADALKTLADDDGDGRVSVREFRAARDWIAARYGLSAAASGAR